MTRLLQRGEPRQAAELCRHLLARAPGDFPTLRLLSRACQASGDLDDMLQAARAASEARPRNVDARLRLAECLLIAGDVSAALRQAEQVEELAVATGKAGALRRAANFYQRCSQSKAASRCWQQALEIEPDEPLALFGAATSARALGHTQPARKAIDRLIYLQPEHHAAWYLRSCLQRQNIESNHIRQLVYALEHSSDQDPGRMELYYALAKELDDIGRCDEARQVLALGTALRAQQLNYDVGPDLALLDSVHARFRGNVAATAPPAAGRPCPVLLVGLPLSGLEVLAAVLAQRPRAANLGATDMFALSVTKACDGPRLRGAWLEQLDRLDTVALGNDYMRRIEALAPRQQWLLDAQPLNTQYLGLVVKALPQARIVHVHREPKDNALALHRTLLPGQAPWSCDLQQLGRYQRAHEQLMTHWATYCGPHLLSVDYELLLLEPKNQLQRIGEFLDMPGAEDLANLLQRNQMAENAAARQIRSMVDEHPCGRWRRFDQWLKGAGL